MAALPTNCWPDYYTIVAKPTRRIGLAQSAWPFQFIIATHSPILRAYPNATIYNLSSNGIEKIDYYDTEHYQVTHDFLVNPQRMLDRLLDSVLERRKHQPVIRVNAGQEEA